MCTIHNTWYTYVHIYAYIYAHIYNICLHIYKYALSTQCKYICAQYKKIIHMCTYAMHVDMYVHMCENTICIDLCI